VDAAAAVGAQPIGYEQVAVLQRLHAGDEGQAQLGCVLSIEFPGDLAGGRDLEHALGLTAADQRVAVWQANGFVDAADARVLPHGLAGGVELARDAFAFERQQHVAVRQAVEMANLSVRDRFGGGDVDRAYD
jgi:hypothetical protein